jgi:hypothetical protein
MPSITRSTARSTDTTAARSTPWSTTPRTASRSAAGAADAGSSREPEAARAAGRESDSGRPDDGGGGRASTGTHGLVICVKSVRDTVEDGVEADYRLRMGEVAQSEHHDAATVPSADRAITCRRRLALNVLEH